MEKEKKNIFKRHPLITWGLGFGALSGLYMAASNCLTNWTLRNLDSELEEVNTEE